MTSDNEAPDEPIRVTPDNRAAFEGLAQQTTNPDLARRAEELLRDPEQ